MKTGYIVTRIKFTHPLVEQSDDVFTFDNASTLVEGLKLVNPEEFVIIKMKDGIPKRVKLTSNDPAEMYGQLIAS